MDKELYFIHRVIYFHIKVNLKIIKSMDLVKQFIKMVIYIKDILRKESNKGVVNTLGVKNNGKDKYLQDIILMGNVVDLESISIIMVLNILGNGKIIQNKV